MRLAALTSLALLASVGMAAAQNAAPSQGPSGYQLRTVQNLVDLCGTSSDSPDYTASVAMCAGYAAGVLDLHLEQSAYRQSAHRPNARQVCLPEPRPTRAAAIQAFLAWARANPQYMDEPAPEGVMRFVTTQYPCAGAS